jgi:hypothetical protein
MRPADVSAVPLSKLMRSGTALLLSPPLLAPTLPAGCCCCCCGVDPSLCQPMIESTSVRVLLMALAAAAAAGRCGCCCCCGGTTAAAAAAAASVTPVVPPLLLPDLRGFLDSGATADAASTAASTNRSPTCTSFTTRSVTGASGLVTLPVCPLLLPPAKIAVPKTPLLVPSPSSCDVTGPRVVLLLQPSPASAAAAAVDANGEGLMIEGLLPPVLLRGVPVSPPPPSSLPLKGLAPPAAEVRTPVYCCCCCCCWGLDASSASCHICDAKGDLLCSAASCCCCCCCCWWWWCCLGLAVKGSSSVYTANGDPADTPGALLDPAAAAAAAA